MSCGVQLHVVLMDGGAAKAMAMVAAMAVQMQYVLCCVS
jgi:hypothetical protein